MRRNWWSRSLAAILAVWFAVITVGPRLVHSCPMHDAPVARVHLTEHVSAPSLTPTEVTGHESHHAAPSPDQGEQGTSCCTCMSDCSGPTVVWIPLGRSIPPVLAASAIDRGLPDYAYVPVAAAHVLPFANGPPIRA